jgi:peptidoglycan/LPS O-acetylase OafA/YrhL
VGSGLLGSVEPTLRALGLAALMVQSAVIPRAMPYRVLNIRAVAWIGLLSYSIYIWQQPFTVGASAYGLRDTRWLIYPLWTAPALLTAVASYYLLERPLLRRRTRLR